MEDKWTANTNLRLHCKIAAWVLANKLANIKTQPAAIKVFFATLIWVGFVKRIKNAVSLLKGNPDSSVVNDNLNPFIGALGNSETVDGDFRVFEGEFKRIRDQTYEDLGQAPPIAHEKIFGGKYVKKCDQFNIFHSEGAFKQFPSCFDRLQCASLVHHLSKVAASNQSDILEIEDLVFKKLDLV